MTRETKEEPELPPTRGDLMKNVTRVSVPDPRSRDHDYGSARDFLTLASLLADHNQGTSLIKAKNSYCASQRNHFQAPPKSNIH